MCGCGEDEAVGCWEEGSSRNSALVAAEGLGYLDISGSGVEIIEMAKGYLEFGLVVRYEEFFLLSSVLGEDDLGEGRLGNVRVCPI